MRSCENCDWRCSIISTGNTHQVGEHLWCTLPENLFGYSNPCELWQEQKDPRPRGEWVGPQWNY